MVAEWLVSGDGHKNSATKHPLMADGLMMIEVRLPPTLLEGYWE